LTEITIAIVGGFLAGVINTLAGNGSAITLTILTEVLGLPPNVANGTNRIGILAQSVTSSIEFKRKGILSMPLIRPVMLPILAGAFAGVALAVNISNEGFRQIFGLLLIFLLIAILVKPKRWLNAEEFKTNVPNWVKNTLYFLLGVYGGFIQMGMGILFLAMLVLMNNYSITNSNPVKLFVVGIYTLFVLLIFNFKGLVDWELGLIVAVGQASGGWLTANYAARFHWMEKVAYYMLVVIILTAIIYFYNIPSYLF
jgi:uncharacterized membrane protein YfcA